MFQIPAVRRQSSRSQAVAGLLVLAFSLTSGLSLAQVSEPSASPHRVRLMLNENPMEIRGVVRAPAVVFLDAREPVKTEVDITTNSTFVGEVVKSTEQAPFQVPPESPR